MKLNINETNVILHVVIQDSTSTSGAGLTGLAYNSTGIVGGWAHTGDSAATALSFATISTLGTWADPGTNTIGFKEFSSSNMPGWYEIHLPNAFVQSTSYSTRTLGINIRSAQNLSNVVMVPLNIEIQLDENTSNSGTAQAGASGTITLATSASSTDSVYNGQTVRIYAGTGAGQARIITGYVGSTQVATVGTNWNVTPDSTSVYEIILLRSPTVDANGATTIGSGGITAASFATDAINSNIASVYHADIDFLRDSGSGKDEYTVIWFKNGVRQTSGITSTVIEVIKRSDGTDLVASSMTQIGATGSYKYDESSNRLSLGESAVVVVSATIDSSTRTYAKLIGRDN